MKRKNVFVVCLLVGLMAFSGFTVPIGAVEGDEFLEVQEEEVLVDIPPIRWTLCPDGVLEIQGTGDMDNWHDTSWRNYQYEITKISIFSGVTSVRQEVFITLPNLTSVVIGSDVTEIANAAFAGNSRLTSATFIGNAPNMGSDVFSAASQNFTIYRNRCATGFTSPVWHGHPIIAVDCGKVDCELCTTDERTIVARSVIHTDSTMSWVLWSDGVLEIQGAGDMDNWHDTSWRNYHINTK